MTSLNFAIDVLAWILIISGGVFCVIGAYGAVRFPDFWSRVHAVSVSDSAGMILLIAGLCLHSGLNLVTVKLVLIGIFLFLTGPTATHAVANAALVSGFLPKGRARQRLSKDAREVVDSIVSDEVIGEREAGGQ